MDIIHTLAKTKFQWSAVSFEKEEVGKHHIAGKTYTVNRVKVILTDPEGVSQEWECSSNMDLKIVLSNMIIKHWPSHSWLQERQQHYGHLEKVKINESHLDILGELTHTALRKCSDTPQSSILWNAWHEMNGDVIKKMLDASRKLLEAVPTKDGLTTRYEIGNALRAAWKASIEESWYTRRRNNYPTTEERLEDFALKMFWMTLDQVTIEDWVWGIGYYVGDQV